MTFMPAALSSPRFFNPFMLWVDVAFKTQEMLLNSSSVIQLRIGQIAKAGLAPSEADVAEMQLMGHEKLAAVAESGAAIANQLHSTHFALVHRAMRQWLGGAVALVSLATSTTPAQIATHGRAFADAATRSAATLSQLSSASARIMQRGLKPIHAKASANALRLAGPRA
jgi:hypothetical protein